MAVNLRFFDYDGHMVLREMEEKELQAVTALLVHDARPLHQVRQAQHTNARKHILSIPDDLVLYNNNALSDPFVASNDALRKCMKKWPIANSSR